MIHQLLAPYASSDARYDPLDYGIEAFNFKSHDLNI